MDENCLWDKSHARYTNTCGLSHRRYCYFSSISSLLSSSNCPYHVGLASAYTLWLPTRSSSTIVNYNLRSLINFFHLYSSKKLLGLIFSDLIIFLLCAWVFLALWKLVSLSLFSWMNSFLLLVFCFASNILWLFQRLNSILFLHWITYPPFKKGILTARNTGM